MEHTADQASLEDGVHNKVLELIEKGLISNQSLEVVKDLHDTSARFAAHPISFKYGTVQQFHQGLEGLIGSPSHDCLTAMAFEHASDEAFNAWNYNKTRVTTPRAEYAYVVDQEVPSISEMDETDASDRMRRPSRLDEIKHLQAASDAHASRQGWRLQQFAEQPKMVAAELNVPPYVEVAALRLYTGPMYKLYNDVLRNQRRDEYVTTIHAINSGIVKLSKHQKPKTVYRGVQGVLPKEFWTPNDDGVMGGVELAIMSTTERRDVALRYAARQSGASGAKILFEIRTGMIDRGADLRELSQFPDEEEILFAPLTGLEVCNVPEVVRVSDEQDSDSLVIIIQLRLSCNLNNPTIEQVVGRMKASHISFIDSMISDLQLGIRGLPSAALQPLSEAKKQAHKENAQFFLDPRKYVKITESALKANSQCLEMLANEQTWQDGTCDASTKAEHMREAALKCALTDHPKHAAVLLMLAMKAVGLCKEDQASLTTITSGLGDSNLVAMHAAHRLLASRANTWPWGHTLLELGLLIGDRHAAAALARLHGFPMTTLCSAAIGDGLEDHAFDEYKAQPFFLQINTSYPGLQLVCKAPFVFACRDFLSKDECTKLIVLISKSDGIKSSATSEQQSKNRTSSTVIPMKQEEELGWFHDKIVALTQVSKKQLQATKLTRYEKGQFFHRHLDSLFIDRNRKAVKAAMKGEKPELDPVPDRFCTVWVYLNDVQEGGISRFQHNPEDSDHDNLYVKHIPFKAGNAIRLSARPQVNLPLQPREGMAVIHFPTTTWEYGCLSDLHTKHEGEMAISTKYIVQQFIWAAPLDEWETISGRHLPPNVQAAYMS